MKYIFTSESVTEGHPDKICDLISDRVLDAYLAQDENSRVACETCISNDLCVVFGEVTSLGKVDIKSLVYDTIRSLGYTDESLGFKLDDLKIIVNLSEQSPDISQGVNKDDIGAGDQGIMFGYATDETENFMPLPAYLAHKLARRLSEVRKNKILDYLRPDGKTQVSVLYENDVPVSVETILISTQHNEEITLEELKSGITKHVIDYIGCDLITKNTKIIINPTGKFVIGGPKGDSGLTGRKIIVDTYGGFAHHGGGAFSGKDYTKVDRTGAYYARYVAKNIIAKGYASRCEIEISYAIGVSKPVSMYINTFKTNTVDHKIIEDYVNNNFDFRPNNMIIELDLKKPIYSKYTNYGHFGNDASWERIK